MLEGIYTMYLYTFIASIRIEKIEKSSFLIETSRFPLSLKIINLGVRAPARCQPGEGRKNPAITSVASLSKLFIAVLEQWHRTSL